MYFREPLFSQRPEAAPRSPQGHRGLHLSSAAGAETQLLQRPWRCTHSNSTHNNGLLSAPSRTLSSLNAARELHVIPAAAAVPGCCAMVTPGTRCERCTLGTEREPQPCSAGDRSGIHTGKTGFAETQASCPTAETHSTRRKKLHPVLLISSGNG